MFKAIYKILLAGGIGVASIISAHALDLPVKHINGKAFYYYTVDKKDRPYSLAEKLGIKRSDIAKYNPQAADGLQAGMLLTFPVTIDTKVINGYYALDYTPEKGETVYGLAKRFDIPVERIIAFNPQAAKSIHDTTLTIPLQPTSGIAEEPQPAGVDQPVAQTQVVEDEEDIDNIPAEESDEPLEQGRPYIIGKGETLSKIARENGVSVQDILALNPDLNPHKYQAGQRIMIPAEVSLEPVEKSFPEPQPMPVVQPAATIQPAQPVQTSTTQPAEVVELNDIVNQPLEADDSIVVDEMQPASIAIMFPFMLNAPDETKASKLFTEFYRGFLLATEDLSHSGNKIDIYAFDTCASTDTVAQILNQLQDNPIDIFVGADDDAILAQLAADAAPRDAYVLNIFAVKDESYKDNKAMIQANIPHDYMYAKAIDGFINKYKGMTPVFISRVDGQADKIEFTTQLREALDKNGVRYINMPFRNSLNSEILAELSVDSAYVFVPVTGNQIEFNKFAPALKAFRESMVNPSEFALFGYPEWVMFRNDRLDYLHALNTTIYSRFFSSTESPLAAKIADDYKTMFGTEMLEAVPSQGLLGYDTAVFLIKSLRNNDGDFDESSMAYDGVQSGFDISHPDNVKGLVNLNLYFVTFGPERSTTKVQI